MLTIESIQARVQRLEDIKRVEQLQRMYGYYRDNKKTVSGKASLENDFLDAIRKRLAEGAQAVGYALSACRCAGNGHHPYPSGYHVPVPWKHPVTGKQS